MKRYCRGQRKFVLETLGPSRPKSSGQRILILLVESGLIFLVIQVSHFGICWLICPRKILKVLTFLTDSSLVYGLVTV